MQESSLLPLCIGAACIILLPLPGVPARRRACYGVLQIRFVLISLVDVLLGGPLAAPRMPIARHTTATLAGSVTSFRATLQIAYFFALPAAPLVR